MLATILEYAKDPLRLIKENPARGIKKPADGKVERFLAPDEIAALGKVVRDAEAAKEEDRAPLDAIRNYGDGVDGPCDGIDCAKMRSL